METNRKRAKVIPLPTKEETPILINTYIKQGEKGHVLTREKTIDLLSDNTNENLFLRGYTFAYLYFVTDDEIKEGDWFYNPATKGVLYASKEMLSWNSDTTQKHKNWKKIIATTDPELITKEHDSSVPIPRMKEVRLPQLSQAFIEKYCKVGGIDEVDVELTTKCRSEVGTCEWNACRVSGVCNNLKEGIVPYIKVNSHNEITIHPIKDSWTREEVEALCRKAYEDGFYEGSLKDSPCKDPIFWIEENLVSILSG